MPELPEVEVVRRGLAAHVAGRTVREAAVLHPRAVRRHAAGPQDFADRLVGARLAEPQRRGKFLWVPLERPDDGPPADEALVAHLGMSGQLLVQPEDAPAETHLRARVRFADGGPELRFVDQRTFGGLAVDPLTADAVPAPVAHIARDPLDPAFDDAAFVAGLRRRRTGLKRALLDQTLVSGIGNIYADEALWAARLHYARPTETTTRREAATLLAAVRDVMAAALEQGGTSFDALYVNVNGESGYFDRSLHAYGQAGRACARCGTLIRRDAFMGRSSFSCPACQRVPRRPHW
ncbi:bifunctional DNA-formamidopyrimidine glycosylase/DNA-(apurinic or apyrimidinic site) lyase [Motilibacter deserti]|uniref:Formamidopyrimidine-DNA glycosylase n=1 Tax=Motilibacter deserti TaxID=2714956 RepID=A0ABX0GV47_9ACTN|nr:bifunctional DNA-formamidopyrimidine glycosylase/DNA-(apurinic or apyrimidinic site) lyase [Motilibacter deserti]NHC13532.1 bifunctional DNA-formamidopyrimidine glycosylase/DNA-(apurinic or apyrimidinic site) lyase [Motilibacter deserti]